MTAPDNGFQPTLLRVRLNPTVRKTIQSVVSGVVRRVCPLSTIIVLLQHPSRRARFWSGTGRCKTAHCAAPAPFQSLRASRPCPGPRMSSWPTPAVLERHRPGCAAFLRNVAHAGFVGMAEDVHSKDYKTGHGKEYNLDRKLQRAYAIRYPLRRPPALD